MKAVVGISGTSGAATGVATAKLLKAVRTIGIMENFMVEDCCGFVCLAVRMRVRMEICERSWRGTAL